LVTVIPPRNLLIGGALVLLGVVLSIATHNYAALISGAVVFATMALFLWLRTRRRSRGS
jgi:hypothetical protein